jgi:hypothetical protein
MKSNDNPNLLTMKQLMTCNLVEELDGTAILTDKGLQAAARLIERWTKRPCENERLTRQIRSG